MTIKAYTLAITFAVVGPLVVGMMGGSFAAPVLSDASALKAAMPMAATDARYRKDIPRYWGVCRRLGLSDLWAGVRHR